MAANREVILADFQACTGIDDVSECIEHLEETSWNLLAAINRVMPKETQTLPSEQQHSIISPTIFGHTLSSQTVSNSAIDSIPLPWQPGPSEPQLRLINFNVKYKDQSISVLLSETETIGTLKLVLETKVNIPVKQQNLQGWKQQVTDQTQLSSLFLPKENRLFLMTVSNNPCVITPSTVNGESSLVDERLLQIFILNVTDFTDKNSRKEYHLNFPGSRTIQEVKNDIYYLTDVPVRHQLWTGWPETAKDDKMTLSICGINYPCHHLTVTKAPVLNKQVLVDLVDSEDSSAEDAFEDASESFNLEDEMLFQDVDTTRKIQPLVPDNVILYECDALQSFIQEFAARYGECHPVFFLGSLEDALKEACHKPAKDRKPLAVYLHHDLSVQANVFCSQLLCAESVVSYLSTNFITWAWDMTFPANEARLLTLCTQHFGSMAASTIRNFRPDQLPLLLIIMKNRGTTEVFTVIQGNISLDELMTSLIHAVDNFTQQQQVEIREEDDREARERVKQEQDVAYEVSLQCDQAKEEAKKFQEEEKLRQEREWLLEQEKQEQTRLHEEAIKQAIQLSLQQQLPDEPFQNCTEPMTVIRMRMPQGVMKIRRFLFKNSLQVLLNYIASQGFPIEEYKVLTSWPRRDLTLLDPQMSLLEVNLHPQETITLEER